MTHPSERIHQGGKMKQDLANERLLIEPDGKPGRFIGRREADGEIVVRGTRQPLADGARALLRLGFDPATLLTMRMADRPYDSFQPAPIGELAKVSYSEGKNAPLRRIRWEPWQVSDSNAG
jgi:hypothetical protein